MTFQFESVACPIENELLIFYFTTSACKYHFSVSIDVDEMIIFENINKIACGCYEMVYFEDVRSTNSQELLKQKVITLQT